MPYEYSGTTQQQGVGHSNFMLALKVEPNSPTPITLLDQVQATSTGNFTLDLGEWDGRLAVLTVDDNNNEPLAAKGNDWLTGTSAD